MPFVSSSIKLWMPRFSELRKGALCLKTCQTFLPTMQLVQKKDVTKEKFHTFLGPSPESQTVTELDFY